jgi:hypothetical protein
MEAFDYLAELSTSPIAEGKAIRDAHEAMIELDTDRGDDIIDLRSSTDAVATAAAAAPVTRSSEDLQDP